VGLVTKEIPMGTPDKKTVRVIADASHRMFVKGKLEEEVLTRMPTQEVIELLVIGAPDRPALKKAQANNLVRSIRKQLGMFTATGKDTNFEAKKATQDFKDRQKEMQKSFNKSMGVIKKNHSVGGTLETVERTCDRIAEESAEESIAI
jgi:hypothetical protein